MGKMSREDLFREIGEIDEAYVEEARRARRSRRMPPWVGRTLVTAASLAVCLGVGYIAFQMTQEGMGGMSGGMNDASDANGIAMEAAQEEYSLTGGAEEAAPAEAPQSQDGAVPLQGAAMDIVTEAEKAESGGGEIGGLSQSSLESKEVEEESAVRDTGPVQENASDEMHQNILTETCYAMDAMDLPWEAARTDAVYGRYVDVQVPEGYSYTSGTRSASTLHVIWHRGMEEISISCQHADEAISDWLADMEKPEEYDLGLYTIPWAESVPEELIQKVNCATFLPDQISQELVTARSYQAQDQGDVRGWRTQIAILYSDNVLVEIRSKGPSPEEIYGLISLDAQ